MAGLRKKYKLGEFVVSTYASNEKLMYVVDYYHVPDSSRVPKYDKHMHECRYVGDATTHGLTPDYDFWELRPADPEEIKAGRRLDWKG